MAGAVALTANAEDIVLPAGMTALLPPGAQITSSYLAQNVVSRTKDEKPLVVTPSGLMFFTASTDTSGEELWISDGTPGGTRMVADIAPGAESSDPKWLTVVGDKVFFSASTPDEGAELWVSDGTAGGTRLVKDIYYIRRGERRRLRAPGPDRFLWQTAVLRDGRGVGSAARARRHRA